MALTTPRKWLLAVVLDLPDSIPAETIVDVRRKLQAFRDEVLRHPELSEVVELTVLTAAVPVRRLIRPTLAKGCIIPALHSAPVTDLAEGIKVGLLVIQSRLAVYNEQQIEDVKTELIVITNDPDRAESALAHVAETTPYIVSLRPAEQTATTAGNHKISVCSLSSFTFSAIANGVSGQIATSPAKAPIPPSPTVIPAIERFPTEERPKAAESWEPFPMGQPMPGAWAAYQEYLPKNREDPINCSVYAPEKIQPASDFLIVATLFPPKDQEASDQLAKRISLELTPIATKPLLEPLQSGQRITFRLLIKSAQIDEPVQEIRWRGTLTSVEFIASLPDNITSPTVYASLFVFRDSVPLGSFKFTLTVSSAVAEVKQTPTFSRFRQAFISYSSTDRAEVLKRVQGIEASGQTVFVDLLNLSSGERWEAIIRQQIARCDVFYLFWSAEAKRSKWVKFEWQYALDLRSQRLNQSPEIIPVIIEGPPPPEPPRPLRHLHFNDRHLYFIGRS